MVVDNTDSTLPAWLLLLHATDGFVSLEHTVGKGIIKVIAIGPDDLNLHKGFQILDTCLSQYLLHLVQRFKLAHINLVDIFRITDGIPISYPVNALEVVQQLLPRHNMSDLQRVAPIHLVQCLDANSVLESPGSLHHALGIGIAVAHHLQEILVQALDGSHESLLLLVGLSIILLRQ